MTSRDPALSSTRVRSSLTPDFKALFEASPTPLLVIAPPDWTIVAANDARLAVTGTSREDQIGRRLFEAFPDDPGDPNADGVRNLTASLERVVATKSTDTMAVQRYAVRGPDGQFVERWWAPVNTPVLDEEGDVALIIHHVEDVSEVVQLRGEADGRNRAERGQQAVIDRLRKSEAALRESEARRNAALGIARLGTFEWKPASGTIALDARSREIFGFAADEELTAEQVFGRAHPDDLPDVYAAATAAVTAGEPLTIEYRIVLPGGAARTVASFGGPVFGPDGTTERMVGVFADVTERSRAEARLRESEARFSNMSDRAPVMMWVTDPSGYCTYLNARWYEFTSQVPGGREGYGWLDAVHPEDRPIAEQAFMSANAERRDYRVDFRLRHADGVYRWTIDAAAARFGSDGEFLGYVGSVIDIDDRREAEEALAASRATLQAVYDNTPAGLIVAELPSGRLVEANRTLEAIFRHPMHRTDGVDEYRVWESYDADGQRTEAHEYPLARTFATGEAAEGTYKFVRGDGTRAWLRVQTAPIRDASGAMTGGVVAVTDVDEMMRTRDALERLTAGLETQVAERTAERDRMWETSPDLMVLLGTDGVLRRVNPAWFNVLGYEESDLVGTRVDRLVHPDDVELTERALSDASAGPLPIVENRYRHKDGSYRWVSWVAAPAGESIYATGRHITAEREAAEALARAEEQLRQAQKMEAVGQLTGGIAHDFNNLLTGITGSLELMQIRMAQGRTGDVDRYVAAAQGAAKRAAALTHRLLAFSRRQTLAPKPTDIKALVNGMEDLISRSVGPGIDVEVVHAAGLWPSLIDPSQLENAVLNLCINARDAMPDGGRITIETGNRWMDRRAADERGLEPGQYISLCVSDTGAGMTPDVRSKVFEPFFTTKPIGMGTGLGLSMIYGFARQSGGTVSIYSEVDQGTMVCIYLPRHMGDTEAATDAIELGEAPRASVGETVLVVDDEPTVRMLVAEVLTDLGYTAIEAGDGAAGLKIINSDVRIDLLVTDVGLPGGMNGRQVADAARVARPELKVLFITGYAENAVLSHGHLDPGMHVLTKPFAMEALASRIKDLIAG